VHGNPGREREQELVGKQANQIGIALRQRDLADADSRAGTNRGQLTEIAVAPQAKFSRDQSDRFDLADRRKGVSWSKPTKACCVSSERDVGRPRRSI
jgi:hypothetical protein